MTAKQLRVIRDEEKRQIFQFALDSIEPKVGHRLMMSEVFAAYHAWRVSAGLPPTQLSIDSFGRFLPKDAHLAREHVYKNGVGAQGIVGVKIIS